MRTRLQKFRAWTQIGFFVLFITAPALDIFRLDLNLGHFIFFGQAWTLHLEGFQKGEIDSLQAVWNLLRYAFSPILLVVTTFLIVAWGWGRLYCGWLCPHFSVVELINGLMLRAIGKPTIWQAKSSPELQADGSRIEPNKKLLWITILAVPFFAFVWALSMLTYLLPPAEIYANLLTADLTRNQSIFLFVATLLLSIEFGFARHLFCRFVCAVGLFQSLAWMSNRRAMVVSFDREQAARCKACNNACDNHCPMRLKPRTSKRKMFACTQCGECIASCNLVQEGKTLLRWVDGDGAEEQSLPPVVWKQSWNEH